MHVFQEFSGISNGKIRMILESWIEVEWKIIDSFIRFVGTNFEKVLSFSDMKQLFRLDIFWKNSETLKTRKPFLDCALSILAIWLLDIPRHYLNWISHPSRKRSFFLPAGPRLPNTGMGSLPKIISILCRIGPWKKVSLRLWLMRPEPYKYYEIRIVRGPLSERNLHHAQHMDRQKEQADED